MSKCENCIHYEVCDHYHMATDTGEYAYQNIDLEEREDVEEICDHFKDKSLFVELPCKVGTECFEILKNCFKCKYHKYSVFKGYICEAKKVLDEVDFDKDCKYTIVKGIFGTTISFLNIKDFGKTVFLTKEEAEARLKEI